MAEFPEKFASLGLNLPKTRGLASRGGGGPENLKTQGGYFGNFRFQGGGGILAIPPPLGDLCY